MRHSPTRLRSGDLRALPRGTLISTDSPSHLSGWLKWPRRRVIPADRGIRPNSRCRRSAGQWSFLSPEINGYYVSIEISDRPLSCRVIVRGTATTKGMNNMNDGHSAAGPAPELIQETTLVIPIVTHCPRPPQGWAARNTNNYSIAALDFKVNRGPKRFDRVVIRGPRPEPCPSREKKSARRHGRARAACFRDVRRAVRDSRFAIIRRSSTRRST